MLAEHSREHGYISTEAMEPTVEGAEDALKRRLPRVPASWLYAWHGPSFKFTVKATNLGTVIGNCRSRTPKEYPLQ